MQPVLQRLRDLSDLAARAGPYLLLELLLPGGTLFALLLYTYRRRRARRAAAPVVPARGSHWLDGLVSPRAAAGSTTPCHDVLETPAFANADSQPLAA